MKFSRKSQDEPTTAAAADANAPSPTGADVSTASDSLRPAASPAAAERTTGAPHADVAPTAPEHAASTTGDRHAGLTGKGRVRRTRVSALYIGLVVAAILAIFLLIFIAQNSDDVTIRFLGWEGQISLAVAMLLAAVVAVLIVAVPGSLRIGQLRRALRKNAKA